MSNMIICGLSMEMEMAKEMGTVGKCCSCLYFDINVNGTKHCQLKGVLSKENENCEDWIVDHR